MLTLHYLTDSRAQRILWMLEELGCEYEVVVHHRDPKTRLAPRSLRDVHPLGKSPVLIDGDVVMAESGAIVEYLARSYGEEAWMGSSSDEQRDISFWSHYAEGSLMPVLVTLYVIQQAEKMVPGLLRPVLMAVPRKMVDAYFGPTAQSHLAYVEAHLKGREVFVGNRLTVADVMMSFPLEASFGRAAGDYPAIRSYVQRVQDLAGYKRALAAADVPYQYAK
jgi:glutathione S-transferase